MSKASETMATLNAVFREAFHQRDLKVALAMSDWVRNLHRPVDPDVASCIHCRQAWPCAQYAAAIERATDLRARIDA